MFSLPGPVVPAAREVLELVSVPGVTDLHRGEILTCERNHGIPVPPSPALYRSG